jgi:hypothetical protein
VRHRGPWLALGAIALLTIVQTAVHLEVVLGAGRIGTVVDLDRSNGLPDLVSTLALVLATIAAGVVARHAGGATRHAAGALASVLAVLTLADLLHHGPHPHSSGGRVVILLVVTAGVLLAVVARDAGMTSRAAIAGGAAALICSFLVSGLDRIDHWFERERGDPIAEYQIVTKEGLELIGWSLVALGLWDDALRRRREAGRSTARASRAQAASRRRAA